MKPEELRKYAEMLVRLGVNVQPGQTLVVRAVIDAAPLVRLVVEEAYRAGAAHVLLDWSDDEVDRIHYLHAPEQALSVFPEGKYQDFAQALEKGASILKILAPKPQLLRDIDPARIGIFMRASNLAMRRINELTKTGTVSWGIGIYPTPQWASLVFPDLAEEAAVEKLWSNIKIATRLNLDDPITAWNEHVQQLEARTHWLNEQQFTELIFQAPGTDLHVEMPENHVWIGGGLKNAQGVFFLPNMPTEEVFSAPKKTGVNGVVRNTIPLYYNGQFIDGFTLRFEQGKVVEATAEKGEELLKSMLALDENASYLGEVALVQQNSPIAELGVIFQNTLFDENASCHFALGAAYPLCVQGGTKMSSEEREQHGLNTSLSHVDFMVGSAELNVDGVTAQGEVVPLMRNGMWA